MIVFLTNHQKYASLRNQSADWLWQSASCDATHRAALRAAGERIPTGIKDALGMTWKTIPAPINDRLCDDGCSGAAAPKPPLCKGLATVAACGLRLLNTQERCQKSLIFDGGVVTIPQSGCSPDSPLYTRGPLGCVAKINDHFYSGPPNKKGKHLLFRRCFISVFPFAIWVLSAG